VQLIIANRLGTIDELVFTGIKQLRQLNLANNYLIKLASISFAANPFPKLIDNS